MRWYGWRSTRSWWPTRPAPSRWASAPCSKRNPIPFCALESCWLQHLESAHREVVDRLANRLPTPLLRGRVRLPFAKPVDDVTGLNQAIRVLMGCPFLNGLRARRI